MVGGVWGFGGWGGGRGAPGLGGGRGRAPRGQPGHGRCARPAAIPDQAEGPWGVAEDLPHLADPSPPARAAFRCRFVAVLAPTQLEGGSSLSTAQADLSAFLTPFAGRCIYLHSECVV